MRSIANPLTPAPNPAYAARVPHRYPLALVVAVAFSCGCTAAKPVLPQTPATVTVPVVAESAPPETKAYHCDGTPFHIGDNDYCAYDTPVSWGEARRSCEAISGRLVSFSSQDNANAINAALGPAIDISAEAYWIGLTEPDQEEGTWKWSDGSRASYTHWNKGEPNDDGENEDCAEWKIGTGSWNDAPCWDARRYICQQQGTKPMVCDGPRVHAVGGDFCFAPETVDYETATERCKKAGGALAVLSTKEKDEALHKAVGPKLGMPAIWIGYNDIAREGTWRWISGARFDFDGWKSGEPNDFRGEEDCAEWYPEDGLMNDLPCMSKRPYLCERLPN
jgi:C-type mannose receptor